MYRVVLLVSFTVLFSSAAAVAQGDGGAASLVEQAKVDLDDLEYEKARKTLARAEHTGRSDADELAEIYRLSGIVLGAYGDEDAAERYFSRWLAIRPDARLEAGFAPKIAEPFARARVQMAARDPLRVSALARDDGRTLALVVESDPLAMIDGAVARFRTADGVTRRVRARGDGPYTVAIPTGVEGVVQLVALDRHGNHLAEVRHTFELEEEAVPLVETPPTEQPDAPPSGRPIYAQWYVWGGVATALAGGSAYFGLRAQSDQRQLDGLIRNSGEHEYAAAREVEARGRRHALLANATCAAAIAAGGAAAVFLITQLGSDSGAEGRSARAFAAPIRGGGAAMVELSF